MTIVSVDDRSREILSNEHGGIVRAWNHLVRVLDAPGGRTRYVDHVEIEAGPWTPVVWAWGQLQYHYRQARWRALAKKIGARRPDHHPQRPLDGRRRFER